MQSNNRRKKKSSSMPARRRANPSPTMSIVPGRSQRPPPYTSNYKGFKIFRFTNLTTTTSTLFSFNAAKLGALISFGTSTTTAQQLFSEVRLKYVEVWSASPNATSGLPSQIAVSYPGNIAGAVGDSRTKSDISVGNTWAAHVKLAPPFRSQASQWQTADNNSAYIATALFTIDINSPCIVDVAISFNIPTIARGSAGAMNLVTSVLGTIYYLALDNPCSGTLSGSSLFIPDESLATTK